MLSGYEATWTWDGSAIAYVSYAGSGERALLTAPGDESFFSIASLNY